MSLNLHDVAVAAAPGRPPLLEHLDLHCAPGTITALVGPNGAGKTTLLRAMAGLIPVVAGRIALEGKELGDWNPRHRAQRCGFMAQRLDLQVELTVGEVVELGRLPHRSHLTSLGRDDQRAIAHALAIAQVGDFANRPLSTLSGGEVQRVLFARLLATQATYLFLDEPTTAMDIGHSLDLLALLRDLARDGHAIVVSLHELELARRFADFALCVGSTFEHHWHAGPAADVLVPSVLASLFQVDVTLAQNHLSFEPRYQHFARRKELFAL